MISLKLSVLLVLTAAAATIAQEPSPTTKPTAKILSENSFVNENGYNFDFETSDGVSRQEEAKLITVGDHQGIGIKGSYSYTGPDGQHYVVSFTADDKGYKPEIRIVPATGQ